MRREPLSSDSVTRRAWDSFKRWPWWGQSLGILTVVILLVGALSLLPQGDPPPGILNAQGGVDATDGVAGISGDVGPTETNEPPPPDVVGENVTDAEKQLDEAGFEVVEVSRFSHQASGTVLEQEDQITGEAAGTLSVLLVVAEPFPRIPGVVGLALPEARDVLSSNDYAANVRYVYSDDVAEGRVVTQSPERRTEARPGRTVRLVVSDGPKPGPYDNPWGYNFVSGSLIYRPANHFCDYFDCISSFWSGSGYVIQCEDGEFSQSGGLQGSCSYHGGNLRAFLDA